MDLSNYKAVVIGGAGLAGLMWSTPAECWKFAVCMMFSPYQKPRMIH